MTEALNDIISHYFQIEFPLKRVSQNQNKEDKTSITPGILTSMNIVKQHHVKNSTLILNKIKIFSIVIFAAKKLYNRTYIQNSTNKGKAIWNIVINTVGGNTKGMSPLIHYGIKVFGHKEISNIIKTHFTDIAEKLFLKCNQLRYLIHQRIKRQINSCFSMLLLPLKY